MIIVFRIIGGFFTSILGIIGIVWAVVALILSLIFWFPLLGWVNWLVIPFTVLGLVFSMLASINEDTKQLGKAGLVIGCTALGLSILRLILGGGIL